MYSGADPWFKMKLIQKEFVGIGSCLRDGAKRSGGSGAAGLFVVGNGCGSNIVSLQMKFLCQQRRCT